MIFQEIPSGQHDPDDALGTSGLTQEEEEKPTVEEEQKLTVEEEQKLTVEEEQEEEEPKGKGEAKSKGRAKSKGKVKSRAKGLLKEGEEEEEGSAVKAKGKSKAKAKAKTTSALLALKDWGEFEANEEETHKEQGQSETRGIKRLAAEMGEGETTDAPRQRSRHVLFELGQDEDGNTLPRDNDRTWTAAQKYVWDKIVPNLCEQDKDEWNALVQKKDPTRNLKLSINKSFFL